MQHPGSSGHHDLLERFRAGDRDAFSCIYRLYSPAVFRFAAHMSCDRVLAGEIVQDVFIWLIDHPAGFDPARGELSAYLIGVTRKFLKRHRQAGRRWVSFDRIHEIGASLRQLDGADERSAARQKSRSDLLHEAIAALPSRYREVVILCDIEGATYEAAAQALECAVGTIRSRLHRARQLLGRKLQAKNEVQGCTV